MLQSIRKNQKKILAVLGVFLMVAFVADMGFRRGWSGGGDGETGSRIGDEKIQQSDLRMAYQDWQALNRGDRTGMGSTAHMLLARRLMDSMPPQDAFQLAAAIVRQLDPMTYLLLLKEAQQMNVRVGNDMVQTILAQLEPTDEPEVRERAVANWLTILEAFNRVQGAVKVTPAMATYLATRLEQRISLKLVELKAADFKASIPDPTSEQLQAFFQAHKDLYPENSPDGFGYHYPNRVKIEYIAVPLEKLKATVTDEDIYKHWKDNQHLYPTTQPAEEPTTQPSTKPALASTRPTTRPWTEVKDQIRERLTNDLVRTMFNNMRQSFATDWPNYRQAVKATGATTRPATSLGVPYDSYEYLQKLQAKIQAMKQSHGVLPEVGRYDRFMTAKELADLPGLGKAGSIRREDQQYGSLAEFVIGRLDNFLTEAQRKEARERNANTVMLYEAWPFVSETDYYYVRVTAADPAHAPASLAEVETKVKDDWKTARAYDKALAEARKLVDAARTQGLEAAAKASGDRKVITTGSFSAAPNQLIENYTVPEQSHSKFFEGAFDLLNQRLRTGQEHPLGTIELPASASAVVAQIDTFTPAVKDQFFPQRVSLFQQQIQSEESRAILFNWFARQAIEQRMKFTSEEKADTGRQPSAPPNEIPPSPF